MVIVDVFNVLHASGRDGVPRLDASRLKGLIAAGRWGGEHVVLVYDGSGGVRGAGGVHAAEVGLGLESKGAGISEVHAAAAVGAGRDADSVIEALLEREERMGRSRQVVVVSSDKRVRAAATGARARAMTAQAFLQTLAEDGRKAMRRAAERDGGRPAFATDEGMDAGRTAYWLEQFGLGGAEGGEGRGEPEVRRGESPRQEWGERIDVNDLDMGEILRRRPPGRGRDDEDDESGAG